MASTTRYMLKRDEAESKRLDFQHEFMRALCHGDFLHTSIPRHSICAVADMGTGTGIWLSDVAEELRRHNGTGAALDLVGFDISAKQFPENDDQTSRVGFVVHDITKPFPEQYHSRFDVVNLRFLVYALSEADLQQAFDNVAETLRPGGYIQWQEIDIIDVWATPAIKAARDAVMCIVQEKVARALNVSMPTQMVKTILNPRIQDDSVDNHFMSTNPHTSLNAISFNHDLFRISSLETLSTYNHPSPKVQAEKDAVGLAINCQLLSAGAARMRELSQRVEEEERDGLIAAAKKYEELAVAIEKATNDKIAKWDADATWIVARRAIVVPQIEDWMGARRANLSNS